LIVAPAAGLVATLVAGLASAATLRVAPGQSVQAALDRAADGDVVLLEPGEHRGDVVVRRRVALRGPGATLDGGGKGTVVRVEGAFASVEDIALRGSGKDLGAPDACVYVAKEATGAAVRRISTRCQAFGVWVHQTLGARIEDSVVQGSTEGPRPERGNAIQLFDGSKLVVRGNRVSGGRDGIYISATDDSEILDNVVEQTRYGIHYMYAHRNVVRGNRVSNNQSGIALMYSRGLTAEGNHAENNDESGLFLRDIEDCVIRDNRSVGNGMGMFFYSATTNLLEHNLIRDNGIGVKIWGGSIDNRVTKNAFIGNRTQVFFVATRDLVFGAEHAGNYWSDYMGWDQNRDGFGDRPYRVDSFTTNLVHKYPSAVLLLRSPALELLGHLEQRLPLLRVPTVIDRRPLSTTDL
jgi:nitrous oxidase accessory protein